MRLLEGTLAARAAGETEHATSSHHHQGIDRLGDGLVVSGYSTLDDLPEAIELDGSPPSRPSDRRFVLGVQWHPEADVASTVIGALVAAATAEPVMGEAAVEEPAAPHIQARGIAS